MNRNTLIISAVLLATSLFIASDKILLSGRMQNFLAATFFIDSITVKDLRDKFVNAPLTGERVKILIMPGHEPDFGGAEFGSLKERDMNIDLSLRLAAYLKTGPHFEVILARDKNGWNPELESYFDNNWDDIKRFRKAKKAEMAYLVDQGKLVRVTGGDYHNSAPSDVGIRLFGINKWSAEKGVDIVLHVHFNDHPRPRTNLPGQYKGFAIYVPERQYSNAKATHALARSIFESLEVSFAVSDLPKEDVGIVHSQDLIAIGESNTVDAVSMLIEYGYIYRPTFTNPADRENAFSEMARLTYLGIQDFFIE